MDIRFPNLFHNDCSGAPVYIYLAHCYDSKIRTLYIAGIQYSIYLDASYTPLKYCMIITQNLRQFFQVKQKRGLNSFLYAYLYLFKMK